MAVFGHVRLQHHTLPIWGRWHNKQRYYLILNYLHKGGTNPQSRARQFLDGFPLPSYGGMGKDDSENPSAWGHCAPEFCSLLQIRSVQFSAQGGSLNRRINFTTSYGPLMANLGMADKEARVPIMLTEYELAPDHTSLTPQNQTQVLNAFGVINDGPCFLEAWQSDLTYCPYGYCAGVGSWTCQRGFWLVDDCAHPGTLSDTWHQVSSSFLDSVFSVPSGVDGILAQLNMAKQSLEAAADVVLRAQSDFKLAESKMDHLTKELHTRLLFVEPLENTRSHHHSSHHSMTSGSKSSSLKLKTPVLLPTNPAISSVTFSPTEVHTMHHHTEIPRVHKHHHTTHGQSGVHDHHHSNSIANGEERKINITEPPQPQTLPAPVARVSSMVHHVVP